MAKKPKILKVYKKRNFSLHHTLIDAARMAMDSAERKEPGFELHQLICVTMSSLAIESLVNAHGEAIVENWVHHERAPTISKLLIVAQVLKVEVDFEKSPWKDIKWLYGLRNQIAHSKPEKIEEVKNMTADQYLKDFDRPKSKLEKQITLGNAQRAHKAAYELRDAFYFEDEDGLYFDSWQSVSSDNHHGS